MTEHPVIAAILGHGGPPEPDKEEVADDLVACCHDFIAAVEKKDSAACAEAFRACFQCCESEPHEEHEPEQE